MLFHICYPLKDWWFGFNVFRYITFRAAMAAVTAFLLTLVIAPFLVKRLKAMRVHHGVRDQAEVGALYDLHRHKEQTPTMGGLLILLALAGSTLLWADPMEWKVLLAVGTAVALGLLGFWDDWTKVCSGRPRGLTKRLRLAVQAAIGMVFLACLLGDPAYPTTLEVPFLKEPVMQMGLWMIPFGLLVLVGTTNAVNLADGLDGLAIGCVTMVALCLTLLTYLTGHAGFADYLLIHFIPGAGELTVFCAALVGASLGFLWYNAPPASLFMGDTGSLALGGAVGAVAILIKKELLLVLLGGIFVAEALSVILQVGAFRLWGKRVFRMAPLHHHFQLAGWAETKVTVRFWIVGAILALVSLSTLKLR